MCVIQERPSQVHRQQTVLPAAVNCFAFNLPFRRLIIPTMCDIGSVYILFPFLPYYVAYILDPTGKCNVNNISNNLICKSTYWICFLTVSYLFGAVISLPVWLLGLKLNGRRNIWISGSIIQIIGFPFLALMDNYFIIPMITFFVIGFGQGSNFVQSILIGDIIDYEEYIQSRRIEGTMAG